jgi:hypothetical protein
MAKDTFDNRDELDQPVATDTLGNALIYITAILLVVAFVVMEKALAEKFNAGMFADTSKSTTK